MASAGKSETLDKDARGSKEPEVPPASNGPGCGATLVDIVALEQRRAERYRHYFVVALLSPKKVGLPVLVRIASRCVRASDVLGAVGPDGRFRWHRPGGNSRSLEAEQAEWAACSCVGVLFPQTGRRGAEVAIRRITDMLVVDSAVSVKCAVYPDDSTDPSELVGIASA